MQKTILPEELIALARQAMQNAYAPYSTYCVGAALLCADGTVYTGCNIENASYTPTVCAERVAFFKAISEGKHVFHSIAVVGGKKKEISDFFPPCGVCRQVMREFCDPDSFLIHLGGANGQIMTLTLAQMLPYGFSQKDMK